MLSTLPTYQVTRWSLDDLFSAPDSPAVQAEIASMNQRLEALEARRAELTPEISAAAFMAFVTEIEQLNVSGIKLYAYGMLWFAGETQNQQAQTFVAQIQETLAEMENRTLFFTLWWKALDNANAERLMAGSGDFRYYLEATRQFKPYTLSEAEEKIINIKNVTGVQSIQRIYETITNRYMFKLEVNGETKELTRGQLTMYVRQHDANLRAQAYQEMYRVYGDDGDLLGQIYQALMRDWRNENLKLRNIASPISVRNLYNDIPDAVVDTLLQVCEANAPLFQRFFKLKARWLKMDRLRRYDVYAPVVKSDKEYTFGEAAHKVLHSFNDFDPEIANMAQKIFDENHLDSEVRKGKRSGAFCMSVTSKMTPWVLVNYQGRADDVATLAHELGHAIHSLLASGHSQLTFHASLPLAETASTFSEMLLVDQLLAEETDESVRRDILFRQVDDAYATIMRQAFFAIFERQAHEMVSQGASVDELSAAYMENLQRQFGDSLEIADEFRWEWVSIPHIYEYPFYVYAYAFGQLLVLALYKQYKAEGESFIPRYKKVLAAGGSAAPMKILEEAGIDASQAAFWQGGFDVIRELVDELEALPVPE